MKELEFNPPLSTHGFLRSTNFGSLIVGPVGSTKTTAGIMKIARHAAQMAQCHDGVRRSRAVWIRNTVQQLNDTSIPDFLKWYPDGEAGMMQKTDKKFTIRFLHDDNTLVECEVLFRGLDDANDVRRLLSLQASFAIMDEFREIHKDIFEAVQGRLGRYPDGMLVPHRPEWGLDAKGNPIQGCVTDDGLPNSHIWGMTNPPDMDTFWETFMTDPPDNFDTFIQPSGLSKEADWVHLLPSMYYENLMKGKTEEYIDVYIHAKFGRSLAGKPVHRSFTRDFHVAKEPLKPILNGLRPIVIGMDFGLNPSATIGQLDARGRLLVFSALTSDGMGLVRFVDTILKPHLAMKFPGAPFVVVGDPAGRQRAQTDESTVYDILRNKGFKAMPAGTNSIIARISAVDAFLLRNVDGGAGILLDPVDCGPLIKAWSGRYRYRIKKDGEIEDTPEKNEASHISDSCFAAGTRISTPDGLRAIETLREGDYVLTPAGARRVLAAGCTGVKQTLRATFSNGAAFVATANHPVFVHGKGFVTLDTLQYVDILHSVSSNWGVKWLLSTLFKSSTARSIIVNRPGITKHSTTRQWVRDICTVMFGPSTTGLSQAGGTCTTSMGTERTTALRTSNACANTNTQSTTWRNGPTVGGSTLFPRPVTRPQHGTSLKKDASGTETTLWRAVLALLSPKSAFAYIAGKPTVAEKAGPNEGFALCLAKEWPVKRLVLTTLMFVVKSAERASAAISTRQERRALKLVAIAPSASPEPVYNLTVSEQEMYYAEGVLVHNCQYLCMHAEAVAGGKLLSQKRREVKVSSAAGWT